MVSWRDVKEWCHQGGDDQFGLCFWAMCGNLAVLDGRGVMSVGEIENAAREMNGFDPYIHATDKGENLEAGFRYIQERGWPGDSTLTISAWSPVELPDVAATIARRGSAPAWLMLPMSEDGFSGYAFEDEALFRGAPGRYAHAVLIVEDDGRDLTFVTWARTQTVSRSWWQAYGRQAYDVAWSDIA